jgi:Bacterial capsule synthesis protein PGA_cap
MPRVPSGAELARIVVSQLREADRFVASRLRDAGRTATPRLREADRYVASRLRDGGRTVTPVLRDAGRAVAPVLRDAGRAVAPVLREADRIVAPLLRPRIIAPVLLAAAAIAVVIVVMTSLHSEPSAAARVEEFYGDELPPSLARHREAADRPRQAAPERPQPAAPEPPPRSLTVGWVGDTVLGSRHGVPPDGGRSLLAGVRPALRKPDVMIGNLEGVIGTGGAPKCPVGTPNCFAFQAPPEAAKTLSWAGFEVMNLANNHANDYGSAALDETIGHLKDAGVRHTGRPGQVTRLRRHGLDIAVLGFAAYPWSARLDDIPEAVALVRRARKTADVVVVTMHAGAEGASQVHTPQGEEVAFGESRGNTRGFAHAVVDAGADVVFGSGPHVIRGIERYRDVPIVYSTGNFAGYHTFPTTGALGLSAIVQVSLDDRGRFRRGRWTPLRLLPPGRPMLDPSRASAKLAAQLSQQDFKRPGIRPSGRLAAGKDRPVATTSPATAAPPTTASPTAPAVGQPTAPAVEQPTADPSA